MPTFIGSRVNLHGHPKIQDVIRYVHNLVKFCDFHAHSFVAPTNFFYKVHNVSMLAFSVINFISGQFIAFQPHFPLHGSKACSTHMSHRVFAVLAAAKAGRCGKNGLVLRPSPLSRCDMFRACGGELSVHLAGTHHGKQQSSRTTVVGLRTVLLLRTVAHEFFCSCQLATTPLSTTNIPVARKCSSWVG